MASSRFESSTSRRSSRAWARNRVTTASAMRLGSPEPRASLTSGWSGAPWRHRVTTGPGASSVAATTQIVAVGRVIRAAAATARDTMSNPAAGCDSVQMARSAVAATVGAHAAAACRACRAAPSAVPKAAAASVPSRPATSRRHAVTPSCQVSVRTFSAQGRSARRPRRARSSMSVASHSARPKAGQSSPPSDRPPRRAS